jgi:hypothetical protein
VFAFRKAHREKIITLMFKFEKNGSGVAVSRAAAPSVRRDGPSALDKLKALSSSAAPAEPAGTKETANPAEPGNVQAHVPGPAAAPGYVARFFFFFFFFFLSHSLQFFFFFFFESPSHCERRGKTVVLDARATAAISRARAEERERAAERGLSRPAAKVQCKLLLLFFLCDQHRGKFNFRLLEHTHLSPTPSHATNRHRSR